MEAATNFWSKLSVQLALCCIGIAISLDSLSQEPVVSGDRATREIATCENEKPLFWALSIAAGFTPYTSVSKLNGGENISFETLDGVSLSGAKLAADGPTDTYVLILQGNGFPAGRLIQEFGLIRDEGVDVYAFDYRGYKKSGGKRRFWAMLQDYHEILNDLNSRYSKRIIYATSFGGVIAANTISDYRLYDLVFFDSVISRASYVINCDRDYDPVNALPATCESLVVQENGQDRFQNMGLLSELTEKVEECGGRSESQPNLAHPFEEKEEAISRRMSEFLRVVRSAL